MAKRRREAESDSEMPSAAEYYIVFVDTSLDTRLAMEVSVTDTVLDFKRKLTMEHAKCFSKNGEIQIHSVKVKCEGNFYLLPDSMLVCRALQEIEGNWLISADVSVSLECNINQKASECDTRDQCGVMSSGANKILALTTSPPDGVPEEDVVLPMTLGQKVEKYSDRTSEFWKNDSLEKPLGTISPAKKKRKLKYHEDVLHSPTLEDRCTQFHASGEETLQPVLAGSKISVCKETPNIMPYCVEETTEDVIVRYASSNLKCSGVVEGASIAAATADASKQKKNKKRIKNMLSEQVIETTLSSSYCKQDKNFFAYTADSPGKDNLSELSGIPEDGRCDNNIRASCPAKGTDMKDIYSCHLTLKIENPKRCSEFKVKRKSSSAINDAHKMDGKDKETDQLDMYDEQTSQNLDHVLLKTEKIGSLDEHEALGNTMESFPADGEHSDDGLHLTPIAVPNLDLSLLNDPETIKTNSISPIAKPGLDVTTKEDRKLFVNQEIEMNQPEAGVSIIEPTLSSRLIHTPGAPDDTHYNHDKKKKKKNKTKKSAGKIQDTSYGESEAQKAIGDDGLCHDSELKLPSSCKASEYTDSESKLNEAMFTTKLLDRDMVEELKASRGHRRKQSVKKSPNTAMDNSDMEPANNGVNGSSAVSLCSPVNRLPKETGRGENLLFHKVKDVQTKMLYDSAAYSKRKVGDVTINESDSVKKTQTMEDVGICEQNMENKGHNSVDDCLPVPSVCEKENQVNSLELNAQSSIEIVRILPIAKADMDMGRKKDRKLLVDHEIGMNQPEAGISIRESTIPSRLIHTSGAHGDTHDNHDKKKKRKTKKSAGKIQDTSYGETEAQKTTGGDGLHHDSEVMLQSSSKASGCTDSGLKSNEALFTTTLLDGDMVEELKTSRGHRRKQSVKKSPNTAMDHSDMEPANNGTGGSSAVSLCLPADHFLKETANGENLLFHKVMDVQTRMLDDLASYSERKVGDATINESDSMKLTQTMEDVGICEQRMKKKRHNSAGDCLTVPSVSEKENQGNNLESNRAQNGFEIVSIWPIAKAVMDLETKKDRVLLVNPEIGMNQPEAGVSIMESTLPSRLIHTSGADDDTHDTHDKKNKKKKKTKKSTGKIRNTSYGENEAQKATGDDGLHHDSEVMLQSSSKASGCTDSELKSNEARFTTTDGDMVEGLEASRDQRRKQSVKKSHNTAMNNSDMEPANNGMTGSSTVLLHSATDQFPEEIGKGENLSFHKVKDVRTEMLDDSASCSERKVGDATINESDTMKLTQTMVDIGICEQRMKKKGHNSAGDCLTVPSFGEKENQGNNMESNQSQNSIKIVAKKKKKGHHIASDCLENIPLKDQEVVVEAYPTVENANNSLEQVDQLVDSQVFSNKNEERLGEIHFTADSSDNLVRHVEDKDEGINFKHYFLPGQKQDKVAYVDKVKEATKSSEEMKSVRKVKKHGLPSVSTSTESHNLTKLSENKDRKDKPRVRCSTGKKYGDFVASSKVSDNGMLDSSPTEMCGMTTLKTHKENTVASLFTKDKNMPLDKTYLERSGISSGNGGNKRQLSDLNVSDKVVMNTPRKNSLFERVGSLFQDCSGESSNDENRTANSDASTHSPSDSSSQSVCSAGESDLSQASARNRSNDAQGRITREKNNAKLDLSASNEVTLDMILRSSKRFKKAKLTTVSQIELEQTDSLLEFVPDSQPIN